MSNQIKVEEAYIHTQIKTAQPTKIVCCKIKIHLYKNSTLINYRGRKLGHCGENHIWIEFHN